MDKFLKLNMRILVVYFFLILAVGLLGNKSESKEGVGEIAQANSEQISITPIDAEKPTRQREVKSRQSQTPSITPSRQEEVPLPQKERTLSDDLALHNNPGDCWIYIEGHIYDITTYFGSHPGGDAIMAKYCGSDATSAFNSKEKGIPHSGSARAMLANFLIQ